MGFGGHRKGAITRIRSILVHDSYTGWLHIGSHRQLCIWHQMRLVKKDPKYLTLEGDNPLLSASWRHTRGATMPTRDVRAQAVLRDADPSCVWHVHQGSSAANSHFRSLMVAGRRLARESPMLLGIFRSDSPEGRAERIRTPVQMPEYGSNMDQVPAIPEPPPRTAVGGTSGPQRIQTSMHCHTRCADRGMDMRHHP